MYLYFRFFFSFHLNLCVPVQVHILHINRQRFLFVETAFGSIVSLASTAWKVISSALYYLTIIWLTRVFIHSIMRTRSVIINSVNFISTTKKIKYALVWKRSYFTFYFVYLTISCFFILFLVFFVKFLHQLCQNID